MAVEKKHRSTTVPASRPAVRSRLVQGLERLVHERTRLGIVSSLAVADSLSFAELKATLGISDGNLSSHARKLEDAGYIACDKQFSGRKPLTTYRLTPEGRQALARYLTHMEALIEATRES